MILLFCTNGKKRQLTAANSQKHHFYVDTKTKRSTWLHPYDDPEYLRSLPDTHPAHPDSAQARAVRKQSEDEETMHRKMVEEREREEAKRTGGSNSAQSTHEAAAAAISGGAKGKGKEHHRNWFQKKKDQVIGTKEERAQEKENRRKQREEEKKRQMASTTIDCIPGSLTDALQRLQQEYIMRRKELIERQMNDPNIRESSWLRPTYVGMY